MKNKKITILEAIKNDFFEIFIDMQEQFPAEELKTYEDFLLLLNKNCYRFYKVFLESKVIGYFLLLINQENRTLWLDYVAVFREHQSLGFGASVLDGIRNLFPQYKGIYIEVEKENLENINTKRRVAFYKKVGAKKLDFKYFFPTKESCLEMDLYLLPFECSYIAPDVDEILESVKYAFDMIHSNLEHLDSVFKQIKNLNSK